MVERDNLVLEYLRAMRAEMSKLLDRMNTLTVEMTAVRQQLMGVATLVEHDHSEIAVIKIRLDRIEQRLELTD